MSNTFEKMMMSDKTGFVKRTVCEVLREIYWHTQDPVVREKALEAIGMAKRMDSKLREYKADWDKNEWKTIENATEIAEARRAQYEREKSGDDVC